MIKIDPKNVDAHADLSWSLSVNNQYGEAIKEVDESIRLDSSYAFAYYCRGNILEKEELN